MVVHYRNQMRYDNVCFPGTHWDLIINGKYLNYALEEGIELNVRNRQQPFVLMMERSALGVWESELFWENSYGTKNKKEIMDNLITSKRKDWYTYLGVMIFKISSNLQWKLTLMSWRCYRWRYQTSPLHLKILIDCLVADLTNTNKEKGKKGESDRERRGSADCGEFFMPPELWSVIWTAKWHPLRLKFWGGVLLDERNNSTLVVYWF